MFSWKFNAKWMLQSLRFFLQMIWRVIYSYTTAPTDFVQCVLPTRLNVGNDGVLLYPINNCEFGRSDGNLVLNVDSGSRKCKCNGTDLAEITWTTMSVESGACDIWLSATSENFLVLQTCDESYFCANIGFQICNQIMLAVVEKSGANLVNENIAIAGRSSLS